MPRKQKDADVGDEHTMWWCERCHASGVIEYAKNESVYDVVRLLEHSHDNHELARLGGCEFSTGLVRVNAVQG